MEKIRTAKFVTQTITAKDPVITDRDGSMNTVLGILAKGSMNCAGPEVDPNAGLFDEQQPVTTGDLHREPRNIREMDSGVVLTEAEKEAQERLRSDAAAKAAESGTTEGTEEEDTKDDDKISGVRKSLKRFFVNLLKEDE